MLIRALLGCALLLAFPTMAANAEGLAGEQMVRIGQYGVRYSAFNSTFLPTQVARSYDLTRSRYTAVLNVSVHDLSHAEQLAVDAEITGSARNLLGNTKQLKFQRVQEGLAIYYLAEFSFANEETFRFTLDITPPEGQADQVRFQQKFYAD